jgi:hypothetical protein
MNPDPMDMLVKLYDLPKSCTVLDRLREQGIHNRRALAAEKHKVAAWVRENFAEGWGGWNRPLGGCQLYPFNQGRIIGVDVGFATVGF